MQGEKRILIVDDDDAIRALLTTVLRRRGFLIDTARNGVEAVERLRSCRYLVMLLDLMMPLVSGWDVIDVLKHEPPEVRPLVIVLTAGPEPRDLPTSVVAATIRKPFDIELLIDTIAGCATSLAERSQPAECPPADSAYPKGVPRTRGNEPN